MTWWQLCLVISTCAFWTLMAVSSGAGMANRIHERREAVEQLKWQVPPDAK